MSAGGRGSFLKHASVDRRLSGGGQDGTVSLEPCPGRGTASGGGITAVPAWDPGCCWRRTTFNASLFLF